MAAFQKANWTRTAGSEKAIQYFPGAITTATVAANSTLLITVTAAWMFKGNGPVDVSLPLGFTLASGMSLGEAVLVAPASAGYPTVHPRIIFKVVNSTAAAITPVATDVIMTQF